jgi:glutaredoxin
VDSDGVERPGASRYSGGNGGDRFEESGNGNYIVCFNCNEKGCTGGCIEISTSRESKTVHFNSEQINGGQAVGTNGRSSRLSSPFASGAQDTEVVVRSVCDENGKNCRETSRTFEVGNLPAGVNKRESLYTCDSTNTCIKTEETDTDASGRVSRSSRDGRSSSSSIKTNGGLQLIEAQPLSIEPYTISDTNIPAHILSFANAPGLASYTKPRKQMGEWLVFGTNTCSYCTLVKKMLSDFNQTIYFLDRNTATVDQKRWIENKGINLEGSVPVVMLNGNIIGGHDKLKEYLDKV